jgi:hypothetical protein
VSRAYAKIGMVKVLLLKFCDYAGRMDGGKGCLIGMFDTIGGSQYPLIHPTFFICVEFEFDPFEAGSVSRIKLVLMDEDGHEMMGIEGEFSVPKSVDGRPATMFETFRVDGMTFPKPGNYRLDVLHNGEPIADARLTLVQGPSPN